MIGELLLLILFWVFFCGTIFIILYGYDELGEIDSWRYETPSLLSKPVLLDVEKTVGYKQDQYISEVIVPSSFYYYFLNKLHDVQSSGGSGIAIGTWVAVIISFFSIILKQLGRIFDSLELNNSGGPLYFFSIIISGGLCVVGIVLTRFFYKKSPFKFPTYSFSESDLLAVSKMESEKILYFNRES